MLVHAQKPIGADAGGEGGAEAQRMASALRAQGEVGGQGTQRLAAAPTRRSGLLFAVPDGIDQEREDGLEQATGGGEQQRPQRVGGTDPEPLGDQQGERHRESGDREPQRDGKAVAG